MCVIKEIIPLKKIKSPLDLIGILASSLCAIHCLVFPFLLTISAFSTYLLNWSNSYIEWLFIGLSIAIAAISLIWSYIRHHHQFQAIWIAALGISLLVGSHFGHPIQTHWLAALGGFLLAAAHVINWRLLITPSRLFISHQYLWIATFVVAALLIHQTTLSEEPELQTKADYLEVVWKTK